MPNYSGKCISFRGQSHIDNNKPCQDTSGYYKCDRYAIASVADGHGSKIRSDVGSKIAIQSSIDVMRKFADDENFNHDLKSDHDSVVKKIWCEIYKLWLEKVFDHSLTHHFTKTECDKYGYPKSIKDVFRYYGTTLITAILSTDYSVVIQIGDGGCVIVYEDGSYQPMSHLIDEKCNKNNETTSISDETAFSEIHYYYSNNTDKKPVSIIVYSDGFEVEEEEDGLKTGSTAYNAVSILCNLPKNNSWYGDICKNLIEWKTKRVNKDDVSISTIYDCDSDFIELYYTHYGQEYPSDYFDNPINDDVSMKVSTNANLQDDGITEFCTIEKMNKITHGTFLNGALINACDEVDIYKCSNPYEHYVKIDQLFKLTPLKSEYIGKTLLDLISFAIIKNNIKDMSELIKTFDYITSQFEEKIISNNNTINNIFTSNDSEKIFAALKLEEIECKPDISNENCANIIKMDDNKWIEKHTLIQKAQNELQNVREWTLNYNGTYKRGVRNGSGTAIVGNTKYVGQFVNGYKEDSKAKEYQNERIIYVGPFINDCRSGSGTLIKYVNNGFVKIKGNFKNGLLNSDDVTEEFYYCKDPNIINNEYVEKINSENSEVRFRGKYVDGKRKGPGKLIKKENGCKTEYDGTFSNDSLNGTCTVKQTILLDKNIDINNAPNYCEIENNGNNILITKSTNNIFVDNNMIFGTDIKYRKYSQISFIKYKTECETLKQMTENQLQRELNELMSDDSSLRNYITQITKQIKIWVIDCEEINNKKVSKKEIQRLIGLIGDLKIPDCVIISKINNILSEHIHKFKWMKEVFERPIITDKKNKRQFEYLVVYNVDQGKYYVKYFTKITDKELR